jgi:hypothetical protein
MQLRDSITFWLFGFRMGWDQNSLGLFILLGFQFLLWTSYGLLFKYRFAEELGLL